MDMMTGERLEDIGKLLRLLVGGLLLFHGADKVLNGPGHVQADLIEHGMPSFLAWGVYVGEVVAPLCVIAGVWTRLWAVFYALSLAFATLTVHGADFLRLASTGAWAAELWVFYIVSPIVVALLGPGRHALRRGEGIWG